MLDQIRALPAATWVRAIPYALIAAVVIAIPADLINTSLFGRPVDPRGIDYVILAVTAALIGTILAIRPEQLTVRDEQDQTRTIWGGFVSFLAVGCPVCNQASSSIELSRNIRFLAKRYSRVGPPATAITRSLRDTTS